MDEVNPDHLNNFYPSNRIWIYLFTGYSFAVMHTFHQYSRGYDHNFLRDLGQWDMLVCTCLSKDSNIDKAVHEFSEILKHTGA
uniref:Uncharacterized protein n=1 Tax=Aegilops tauschii subsp. strangulata TaxID=200361 RepID=A0A452YE87_AEGTS